MNQFGNRGIGGYGERFGLGPAVFMLLVINVAVFVLQLIMKGIFQRDVVAEALAYDTVHTVMRGQVWRIFTYMFLHSTGSFMHLLFNMLGLWLFGSRLEAMWGSRTFTWYYLLCGVGGGILYGAVSWISGSAYEIIPAETGGNIILITDSMVGASGAIYGILLAFGLAFPDAVILFFFFPMRARIAVILFGIMALVGAGGPGIAHMAHLGGMVTGFLLLWLTTGGHPSRAPNLGGGRARQGGYGRAGGYGRPASFTDRVRNAFHRWRTRLRLTVVDSKGDEQRGGGAARPGNGKGTTRREATRVDEILEKISKEGLQSLTPEEQDILRHASRKQ